MQTHIPIVQVSDTTGDDSSNADDKKKLKHFIKVRFITNNFRKKHPQLQNIFTKAPYLFKIPKRVAYMKKIIEDTAYNKHRYFYSVHK